MKKILTIFPVLTLLAGACTNPLEPSFHQDPEIIILNGMLRDDDTLHVIWLSQGMLKEILPLHGAQLHCYINGELAAEGEYLDPGQYNKEVNASKYQLAMRLHPGDVVRLDVEKGALRASATATVPQPATPVAVDTVHVEESPYFIKENTGHGALSCKLRIQDLPGQPNWFRLLSYYHSEVHRPYAEYVIHNQIGFGFLLDPILQDGYLPVAEKMNDLTNLFSGFSTPNMYCSFKDAAFADGSEEVEIHIPDYHYRPYLHDDDENSLQFSLLTISEEEYGYLTQLNKSLYNDMDLGVLQEPVHVPTNVEGGLGFFSIASVKTLVFPL